MGDDTTLRVSTETWRRLHSRKDPGMSFNDVLQELLDEVGDQSAEQAAK